MPQHFSNSVSHAVHTPKYRRQKRSGRPDIAFVQLGDKRIYLGDFDTPQSRQKYHQSFTLAGS